MRAASHARLLSALPPVQIQRWGGYPRRRIVRCQVRPPSPLWKSVVLEPPSRATTQATFVPAALTLVTEHGRVGSPRATTVCHCCPAFLVTWTTGRLRPATIHHTRTSTTLAGHKAVK